MRLLKLYKIRRNSEFRIVYKRGKSFSNRLLVLYTFKNNLDINRIGISISKKIGKAIIRNRIKRLIKEGFRLNYESIEKGYDLVFIVRHPANDKSFKEIESAMKNLFNKAGLCK